MLSIREGRYCTIPILHKIIFVDSVYIMVGDTRGTSIFV
jgi:hypothetical protein